MPISLVSMNLEANLADVRHRMAQAAERVGRDPNDIQLVAVTKGRSAETVRMAYEAGLRTFGENRVQEGISKIDALSDLGQASWHMIGHIQSRKARDVVEAFDLVQSVDRPKIARLLDRLGESAGVMQAVLVECNVSGEESKEGWPMHEESEWEHRLPEFEQLTLLDHLDVRGLMAMAPWRADNALLAAVFGRLRRLGRFLEERLPGTHWAELSMGMTDDFEVAIEQGATMVRIGRAIFGELESAVDV